MRTSKFRRLAAALLTGSAIAIVSLSASVVTASLTPAIAQVSGEFQQALEPYGEWRRNARWGDVWVPDQRPRGWRPYSVGHWIYTDDWGWYWISDDDEADWGWVTYHYGRWIHDRGTWFWVPGNDWGPAWVDWRRSDSYVGWAPLPPDDVMYEYSEEPAYWTFVEPRYVTAPRPRMFFLPQQRALGALRSSVIVNRTFRSGGRVAVNPGISPALIGATSRRPVPTFRVAPRVLAGTQGVSGAVPVRREDFRQRGAPRGVNPVAPISVQRTTTVIQPATAVPKPEPLRQDERGRLGTHPPRAAQGGVGGAAPPSPPPPQQQQPQLAPMSPPAGAPPRPAPQFAPVRPGEPPQARPERPIAPQTPPPPPPQQRQLPPLGAPAPMQSRPASPPPPPPPAVRAPAPPPPPMARPVAPPPPPAAVQKKAPPKPGEKPEKPEDRK